MARRTDNLQVRSPNEARKLGALGGKASGESRRRRKQLRELLEVALAMRDEARGMSNAEAIAAALVDKAKAGDVKAFETLRDTIGEKPIERRESSLQMENLLTKEQRDAAFRGAMLDLAEL